MKENIQCVDMGTIYCPCELAATGDCLVCSRLQGKNSCDCRWQGVCVYNEFLQNGRRTAGLRREGLTKIAGRREYDGGVTVLELSVEKGFAQRASRPGSYLFLRRPQRPSHYDVPLSVLQARETEGRVAVAVKAMGPKTKDLLEAKEELQLRGVYGGGLQGVRYLSPSYVKDKKVLFVTRGVAAAPAMLAMSGMTHRTEVRWIAEKEANRALAIDYSSVCRPEFKDISLPEGQKKLREEMIREQYDVVVIAVAEHFLSGLRSLVQEALPRAAVVWSSSTHVCCGEGICGACTKVGENGEILRMCKCQKEG